MWVITGVGWLIVPVNSCSQITDRLDPHCGVQREYWGRVTDSLDARPPERPSHPGGLPARTGTSRKSTGAMSG